MILVDTSVWIEHIHKRVPRLALAMEAGLVLTHPFVIGELACGGIKARRKFLDLLAELPSAPIVHHAEAIALIELRALMGKGLSYPDVHLLASTAIADDVRLWTNDKKLLAAAESMNLAYRG